MRSKISGDREAVAFGGPTRTRTWDQWIHGLPAFPPGVDYLTTLAAVSPVAVGCGTLKPVIKDTRLGTKKTEPVPR